MLQRSMTLRASGMVSTQALEDAEMRRNIVQSELAVARTRAAQTSQQLQRRLVRAPFDGIVSERKVSSGDTAQIGKELINVIDPSSMRFEGFVSADSIGLVKPGQTVRFRINGYPGQQFPGRVKRIAAQVLRVAFAGVDVGDWGDPTGEARDGAVRLHPDERTDADNIERLPIAVPGVDQMAPLDQIAAITMGKARPASSTRTASARLPSRPMRRAARTAKSR